MSQRPNREIFFLCENRPGAGGMENYLARLSKELERRGQPHRVIYNPVPRKISHLFRVLFYNFWVCFIKGERFYFSLERVGCADVYRAGDGVVREQLRVKKRSLNPMPLINLWLERRCFNKSKHIIANSEMVRRQIIHHYRIAPEKISVVYSGVELNAPAPNGQAVRNEFGIAPDKKIVLYVGSGFERKGVAKLLHLLSKLSGNYRALVVGRDKNLPRYRKLASRYGLDKKVVFTGERKDVNNFYAASDVLLLPTEYEPFSNVVLEAMRFGNAVVTTRQNGAAEILEPELIMAHNQDERILSRLQALLTDDSRLEQVKKRNLDRVRDFSIGENADRTLAFIRRVMDEKQLSFQR